MMSRALSRLFAGDRHFVMTRGLSAVLALGFALLYSKQLGVERRGLLTLVMTTNLVFSILLISGISLHLRNLARNDESRESLGNYLSLVFLFSLLTPILNLFVLEAYQDIFNTGIPNNLTYISFMYCFFSTLSFGMHDALLLIKSIKVASILDIGVLMIQILGYFTLVYVGETSYFVSVLIAISVSYLVMVFASLILIFYIYNPPLKLSLRSTVRLFKESSTPFLVTVTGQLLERIDKVFIGFLTSSAELGRFSTSQSIFGVARFLPDSLTKLSLARDKNFISRTRNFSLLAIFAIPAIFILAWMVSFLVKVVLGEEWMLSITVLVGIALVELLRSIHSVVTMNVIRANRYKMLQSITVIQLIVGLLLQPIAIYWMGIEGSIISGIVLLTFGLLSMKNYFRV